MPPYGQETAPIHWLSWWNYPIPTRFRFISWAPTQFFSSSFLPDYRSWWVDAQKRGTAETECNARRQSMAEKSGAIPRLRKRHQNITNHTVFVNFSPTQKTS